MLRLLRLNPPRPLQFSSNAQPLAIGSIRFSPTFWPFGWKTSQSPIQKSNWRCSAARHAGGGDAGADAAGAVCAHAPDIDSAAAASIGTTRFAPAAEFVFFMLGPSGTP